VSVVGGTIRQRPEATVANGARAKAFTATLFSLVLSLFAMSATHPLPGQASGAALLALPALPDVSGEVKGKVSYEGTLPKFKSLDMVNEPTCAKHYTTPVLPENAVGGPNNSLKNVVIYISAGVQEESPPTQAAIFKQWGCRYVPHVLAVQTNQEIWVQNDDSVAHTVHPMARINKEVNRSQPPGTPPLVIRYDKPEFIRVKCELHPWMRGIFVVLKNSHYSVSDESGSFSLPNLPPGKYTVKAWHEQFGEQTQVVTVGSGETKDLNFVFKAAP
jgi:hypothetical protein